MVKIEVIYVPLGRGRGVSGGVAGGVLGSMAGAWPKVVKNGAKNDAKIVKMTRFLHKNSIAIAIAALWA